MPSLNCWMKFALVLGLTLAAPGLASADPIEQSPIDIITADVVGDPNFKPIVFNYSNAIDLTVKNINSPDVEGTIRGIPTNTALSTLTFDGITYELKQFHFHIDSEHEIDGQRFPMEIHFVNQKVGSSGTNDLLVVGRFIEVSATPNAVLAPFFNGIASIPNDGDTFGLTNFDVASLAPVGQPAYRYAGSLTTAPYTQGVNWNVFYGAPLYLSQSQIDQFGAAFPSGDAREVQPLNGRLVSTAVPEIDPASFGSVVALLSGSLTLMRRRRPQTLARAAA